jgi:hypothetical protein
MAPVVSAVVAFMFRSVTVAELVIAPTVLAAPVDVIVCVRSPVPVTVIAPAVVPPIISSVDDVAPGTNPTDVFAFVTIPLPVISTFVSDATLVNVTLLVDSELFSVSSPEIAAKLIVNALPDTLLTLKTSTPEIVALGIAVEAATSNVMFNVSVPLPKAITSAVFKELFVAVSASTTPYTVSALAVPTTLSALVVKTDEIAAGFARAL